MSLKPAFASSLSGGNEISIVEQLKAKLRDELKEPIRRDTFLDAESLHGVSASISTGIPCVDRLLEGGLPCGKLIEIGGGVASTGRMSLAMSAAREVTQGNHLIAWIDVNNALDPISLQRTGAALERFTWVRLVDSHYERQAFQAAEVIIRSGAFQLLVIDLVGERRITHSTSRWIRLKRLLRGAPMPCLVLTKQNQTNVGPDLLLVCQTRYGKGSVLPQYTLEIRRQRSGSEGQSVAFTFCEANFK